MAGLTLFDLDHVAESNINRQVRRRATLGLHKRAGGWPSAWPTSIRAAVVRVVDDFVQPDSWPAAAAASVDVLIDARDQVKLAARWRNGPCAERAAGVRVARPAAKR